MYNHKLLLVSANQFAIPYPVYPLGISYIYTFLTRHLPDFDIQVFDFNLNSSDEFVGYLTRYQPDFIGLSLRNVDDVNYMVQEKFLDNYQVIVNTIKQTIQTTLIIGGAALSIFPETLFRYFKPDYAIFGEGEDSLFQLLTSLASGSPDLSIEGLVYQVNGEIHVNKKTKFLHTLDLSFQDELIDFYWEKSGMMNVQTKRGCPYNCIYCTYPLIEGSNVRTLDADKIVESLKDLYFNKQVDYVFFTDSVFNICHDYNIDLAEKILSSGVRIKWGAYFSPHNLTMEQLRLFKASGLTHIEFGTEALSDHTLKKYRKHFTIDEVIHVSEMCNEAGIYFAHFLILGGYGDNEDSINEGFENCKRIPNSVFFPYIGMRIYPGTALYRLALKEGYLRADDELLEPVFYLAEDIRYDTLRDRAEKTGKRWVFPDEDVVTFMNRMRERHRKGSLWHHLKK